MTSLQAGAKSVPTTAERVRSVCVKGRALLAVDGGQPVATPVCHLLDDGSVALALDPGLASGVGEAGRLAMLELTDHAPLPLRERVRALVWVRGPLRQVPSDDVDELLDRIAADDPNPALLQVQSPRSLAAKSRRGGGARYLLARLTVESVVVADATGAEAVGVAELLAARPDPLCAIEADWLRHVTSSHPEVIARLAALLPPRLRSGRVHPLAIDRYGMWLRVESDGGDRDIRLGFTRPAEDVAGLNRAVRMLMGCPFRNGLHARRP